MEERHDKKLVDLAAELEVLKQIENSTPESLKAARTNSGLPEQCGIRYISCLRENYSAFSQLQTIAYAMQISIDKEGCDDPNCDCTQRPIKCVSQVVFSDALQCTRWAEAKEVSHKGPISFNYNSHNKVQMYMITLEDIPKLIAKIHVSERNKYFPLTITNYAIT